MFLKLGFKSITMDDIAGEMCISKKRFTNIFTIKNFLSKKAARIQRSSRNNRQHRK
jgi:hypothetical protein